MKAWSSNELSGRTSEIGLPEGASRVVAALQVRQAVAVRQDEQEGLGDQVSASRAVRIAEALAAPALVGQKLADGGNRRSRAASGTVA
jgi:UTP-glucose-1-phosphate uridylyltransferase